MRRPPILFILAWAAFSASCGGGGGGGGGDPTGGLAPGGGGTPVGSVTVPFAAGKRWLYDVDRTNTVSALSTGTQTLEFVGDRLLHAVQELTWEGRTAWKLVQYDLKVNPGAGAGFEVTTIHLSQGPEGLDRWVDTGSGGEWRRILSAQSSAFDNNTFLMAGGPAHDEGTVLTSPVSFAAPAGNFATTRAHHQFTQTGSFESAVIFEERWEYYADDVGLIGATWDYSFDDKDAFSGTDLASVGSVVLKAIDSGPSVLSEIEPNNDGTAAASQAMTVGSIVAAQTHIGNAGRIVNDANVFANVNGQKVLQDWYRFVLPAFGTRHVALAYDIYNYANDHYDDLDLYLFREGAGGALVFVGRSTLDPATNEGREGEWILATNLTAGTYYVAVQAWSTPTDAVEYWIAIR